MARWVDAIILPAQASSGIEKSTLQQTPHLFGASIKDNE